MNGNTNGNGGGSHSGGGNGEAQRFAAEWRQHVMQQLDDHARMTGNLAQTVGDLANVVASLKTSVDDLKKSPDSLRAMFGTYGGCIGQAVYLALGSLDFMIAVAALIVTITHH